MVCSSMQDKNKMQSIAAVETKGTYAVTITEICDKVTRRASNHTCGEELRSWLVVVWMLFTAGSGDPVNPTNLFHISALYECWRPRTPRAPKNNEPYL